MLRFARFRRVQRKETGDPAITSNNKIPALFVIGLALLSGFLLTSAALTGSTEKVLYNFCSVTNCIDGVAPNGGLTLDNAGNLYGTTVGGGGVGDCPPAGCGTVFKLTLNQGKWTEQVLYGFTSPPNAGLVSDKHGNIYGTTNLDGTGQYCPFDFGGCGTVFELISHNGKWTKKILYSFCSAQNCVDGDGPVAGLMIDKAGNLYGTTAAGGASGCGGPGCGTVFELTHKNGNWTESTLYAFTSGKDGDTPFGGLTIDSSGNLYGTTIEGGGSGCGGAGCGTIFELVRNNGKWTENVLHALTGKDGQHPQASLVFDSRGNLYGTAAYGGLYTCNHVTCGTAFELTLKGGKWTEKVLRSFNGTSDGAYPTGLTFDTTGKLYGATYGGGAYGYGTVFELLLDHGRWTEKVLHNFPPGGRDGTNPESLILGTAGKLYGTALQGGDHNNSGAVFEVTP